MNYLTLTFSDLSNDTKDILIALLSGSGFEGFEEKPGSIAAFISADQFDRDEAEKIATQTNTSFTITSLPETNWNELWESNFEPVVVDDFCTIRADFHKILVTSKHDIIITPKMSFGTGHHATTFMMIQQMSAVEMAGKAVLDFGTGTGVLAILAEKMGATNITAVDNDEWSIANASENIERNSCRRIELLQTNTAAINKKFDVILANITKNVITDNFDHIQSNLNVNGSLLLSGLLTDDRQAIHAIAVSGGFELMRKLERGQWISLRYRKIT